MYPLSLEIHGCAEGNFLIASYQCRLASALDAVEANKERSWLLAFRLECFPMLLDAVEDKRHAVLRFVVYDFGHLRSFNELGRGPGLQIQ
jgi:hypothetical protein